MSYFILLYLEIEIILLINLFIFIFRGPSGVLCTDNKTDTFKFLIILSSQLLLIPLIFVLISKANFKFIPNLLILSILPPISWNIMVYSLKLNMKNVICTIAYNLCQLLIGLGLSFYLQKTQGTSSIGFTDAKKELNDSNTLKFKYNNKYIEIQNPFKNYFWTDDSHQNLTPHEYEAMEQINENKRKKQEKKYKQKEKEIWNNIQNNIEDAIKVKLFTIRYKNDKNANIIIKNSNELRKTYLYKLEKKLGDFYIETTDPVKNIHDSVKMPIIFAGRHIQVDNPFFQVGTKHINTGGKKKKDFNKEIQNMIKDQQSNVVKSPVVQVLFKEDNEKEEKKENYIDNFSSLYDKYKYQIENGTGNIHIKMNFLDNLPLLQNIPLKHKKTKKKYEIPNPCIQINNDGDYDFINLDNKDPSEISDQKILGLDEKTRIKRLQESMKLEKKREKQWETYLNIHNVKYIQIPNGSRWSMNSFYKLQKYLEQKITENEPIDLLYDDVQDVQDDIKLEYKEEEDDGDDDIYLEPKSKSIKSKQKPIKLKPIKPKLIKPIKEESSEELQDSSEERQQSSEYDTYLQNFESIQKQLDALGFRR